MILTNLVFVLGLLSLANHFVLTKQAQAHPVKNRKSFPE